MVNGALCVQARRRAYENMAARNFRARVGEGSLLVRTFGEKAEVDVVGPDSEPLRFFHDAPGRLRARRPRDATNQRKADPLFAQQKWNGELHHGLALAA